MEAFNTVKENLIFEGMTKDVPQDFELYYPNEPTFGVLTNYQNHIMEVDAAGEYWGRSVILFSYLKTSKKYEKYEK